MKNGILLILIFVGFSFAGKAQWTQSYTGMDLSRTISVVDDNVAWISDAALPSFAVTVDGGLTWTKKDLPEVIASKHGVLSAVSSTVAYIVCNPGGTATGIYKTIDGGTTWNKQSTGFNEFSPFPDFVYFWNENEGVAVGDATPDGYFEIYTTNNGGELWSRVLPEKMPAGTNEYTVNVRSGSFRVTGDAFFFKVYNPTTPRIFRSTDKGLSWTAITTPYFDSFAFKNINTGLLSYKSSTQSKIYSTTDQGQSWPEFNATGFGSPVEYLPSADTYFSLGSNLSYSNDNGTTWTAHPSFKNAPTYNIGFAPSGKIFISGRQYAYTSTSHTIENTSLTSMQIINARTIDISFSSDVEQASSQDTANYDLYYVPAKANQFLKILTATRDNLDHSLVRLITEEDLPAGTLKILVSNVKSISGIPVINGGAQATFTVENSGIYSSVNYPSEKKIRLYPNPAANVLNISDVPVNSEISIYSVSGKKLMEQTTSGNSEILDISKIKAGAYLIKIKNTGGVILEKFIKH